MKTNAWQSFPLLNLSCNSIFCLCDVPFAPSKRRICHLNFWFLLLNRTLFLWINMASKGTVTSVSAEIIIMTKDDAFDIPNGDFSFVTLYMWSFQWYVRDFYRVFFYTTCYLFTSYGDCYCFYEVITWQKYVYKYNIRNESLVWTLSLSDLNYK